MSTNPIGVDTVSEFLLRTQQLESVTQIRNVFEDTLSGMDSIASFTLTDSLLNLKDPSNQHLDQGWQINDNLSLAVTYRDDTSINQTAPILNALVQVLAVILENQKLSERVGLLDHVLRATEDGIWDWNAVTQQVTFSDRWKSMLGYAPSEIDDQFSEWQRLLHPDDAEAANASAQAFFNNPKVDYHSTFRLLCKDGNYKWILSRGKVAEWLDANKPKRIIGTHMDIDREKSLEHKLTVANAQLKHEQELLMKVGTMAAIGTWRVDLDNNKIFWSQKTRDIHGAPPDYEPNLEEAINFYKPGWSRELIQKKFLTCVNEGAPYDVELILVTHSGAEKWVRAIGMLVPDQDRTLMYGLFQDIDDRVKTMQILEQEQKRAEQASLAKSQFLASMSHEIRTPINGVIGMISHLKQSHLTQRQAYQAELALSSANSLLSIINDILDISKIESNRIGTL